MSLITILLILIPGEYLNSEKRIYPRRFYDFTQVFPYERWGDKRCNLSILKLDPWLSGHVKCYKSVS